MQQKIISPHALDLCTSFSYGKDTWQSIIGYLAKYHRILGQVSYDTFFCLSASQSSMLLASTGSKPMRRLNFTFSDAHADASSSLRHSVYFKNYVK